MKNSIVSKCWKDNLNLWLIAFIALNLVFLPYQLNFFIGNHDWDWVKGTSRILHIDTGLFEGRYAKFILTTVLFGGQILPVLNTLVSFSLLALGAVLLTSYWQLEHKHTRMLVILLVILQPFILGWLYFAINITGNFAAVACVTSGLILAGKEEKKAKLGAVICFLAALGVYPSTLEMMLVCLSIRFILKPPVRGREVLQPLTVIGVSVVLFKSLLVGLAAGGYVYDQYYNLQTVSVKELIFRLPSLIRLCAGQLTATLPFMDSAFKLSGLLLVISAVAKSCWHKDTQKICFWLLALASTVLSAALSVNSAEVAFMPRINFYSLNFLYAGAAAFLLSGSKGWRNAGAILACLLLFISVKSDFEAEKVWHLGRTGEEQLSERLTSRIENRDTARPLIPVMAGEITLRRRFYSEKYTKNSPYILEASFVVRHIPSGLFNFYAVSPLFTENAQITTITPALMSYLRNAKVSWPAEESLYTDDGYAIMLLTKEGLQAIQAQLPY